MSIYPTGQTSSGQVRAHAGFCSWQDASPTRSMVILNISGSLLEVFINRACVPVHERKDVIGAEGLVLLSDCSFANMATEMSEAHQLDYETSWT